MRTITYTFAAGETKNIDIFGQYFRILSGVGLDINFMKENAYIGEKAVSVDAGYYTRPADPFDRLEILSASAQIVKIAVSMGQGGYDLPPTGNVTVTNEVEVKNDSGNPLSVNITNPVQVTPANTQKTVTNASAQLIAANAARKSLIIQNKDPVGRIWLVHGAVPATQSLGLLLEPGEEYAPVIVPTSEIRAIGDAASNANIVVVEG